MNKSKTPKSFLISVALLACMLYLCMLSLGVIFLYSGQPVNGLILMSFSIWRGAVSSRVIFIVISEAGK